MAFDLVASFLVGLLGSLHCVGMCGPLVVAYSLHIRNPQNPETPRSSGWSAGILHHLAFHSGRILTYGLLGALAAALTQQADLSRFFLGFRGVMTLLGGVLMAVLGLVLLRVLSIPRLIAESAQRPGGFWSRRVARLLQSDKLWSGVALGVASGFLPCMLPWAMIVKAATTENVTAGFGTMLLFGLGTMPALLAVGLSASVLSIKVRLWGDRVAALAVTAMGLILLFKGARALL